jgi:hypothetical protein
MNKLKIVKDFNNKLVVGGAFSDFGKALIVLTMVCYLHRLGFPTCTIFTVHYFCMFQPWSYRLHR